MNRYVRQIALFGANGQSRLGAATIALAGTGGLGMHLVQQLAYLGVVRFVVADDDFVDETNLNRLIGALPSDVGRPKVQIAERMILDIQPGAVVVALQDFVPSLTCLAAFTPADLVIGSFDRESPRLALTDWSSTEGKPYVDVATEVQPTATGPVYGGRVMIAGDGKGCLSCLGLIDQDELAREAMTPEQLRQQDAIYGIDRDELAGSGPSVVALNGVVASLAAVEVMCLLTGLRPPTRQLTYRGDAASVRASLDIGREDCPFCLRRRNG